MSFAKLWNPAKQFPFMIIITILINIFTILSYFMSVDNIVG